MSRKIQLFTGDKPLYNHLEAVLDYKQEETTGQDQAQTMVLINMVNDRRMVRV